LIKSLILKGYTENELPEKGWTKRGVNKLLKKLRDTGTVDRRPGSGRPRSARTVENVETVNDLVLSQEDKSQTHRTVREIVYVCVCEGVCVRACVRASVILVYCE